MTKQWFVLHTLTGQELKVKRSIDARVKLEEMGEYIGDVVIPTEKVFETKDGKKRTITRKLFPGYAFINLALYAENDEPGKRTVLEPTWQFLRETPGVIGFVGGDHPMPMGDAEVDSTINQVVEKKEVARPKVEYNPGEMVKINDGPFLGLTGTVHTVDPGKGKLKVEVVIFNRKVLVDVEYWQVERHVEEDVVAP